MATTHIKTIEYSIKIPESFNINVAMVTKTHYNNTKIINTPESLDNEVAMVTTLILNQSIQHKHT